MKRHPFIALALALLVVLAMVTVAEACPGCAEAQAGQGANRENVVRGYFWSIVFMMSMPFLLVGSFGTYCYLNYRKLKAGSVSATTPTTLEAAPQLAIPPSQEPALTATP